MTIRIRELNIKATLSSEQAVDRQEGDKEKMTTSSLLQVFYGNDSPKLDQER